MVCKVFLGDLLADLKIGHYKSREKPKSTARNRCATRTRKSRFLTPFKWRTAFGATLPSSGQALKVAATFRGCWTEMRVADRLVVYASILYGG